MKRSSIQTSSPLIVLNWPDPPVTDAGRGRIHNGIWAKTTSRCFMKLPLGGCQLRVSSLQPPLQNTCLGPSIVKFQIRHKVGKKYPNAVFEVKGSQVISETGANFPPRLCTRWARSITTLCWR